jgi:hypothetical protein
MGATEGCACLGSTRDGGQGHYVTHGLSDMTGEADIQLRSVHEHTLTRDRHWLGSADSSVHVASLARQPLQRTKYCCPGPRHCSCMPLTALLEASPELSRDARSTAAGGRGRRLRALLGRRSAGAPFCVRRAGASGRYSERAAGCILPAVRQPASWEADSQVLTCCQYALASLCCPGSARSMHAPPHNHSHRTIACWCGAG